MSSTILEPSVLPSPCWTADAVLRDCVGFRVVATSGWLGFVEEIRFDDREDVREIVVLGALGRRIVPAAAIESVDADRELVQVREGAV